jgi:hypothetical protein
MLLKIERYRGRQEWWMFDNIRKISISTPISRIELEGNNYDVEIFDIRDDKKNCTCKEPGDGCNFCIKYLVAVCRMEDDSELTIAFDTIAYLMNDSGKTIERIVSNYQIDPDVTE